MNLKNPTKPPDQPKPLDVTRPPDSRAISYAKALSTSKSGLFTSHTGRRDVEDDGRRNSGSAKTTITAPTLQGGLAESSFDCLGSHRPSGHSQNAASSLVDEEKKTSTANVMDNAVLARVGASKNELKAGSRIAEPFHSIRVQEQSARNRFIREKERSKHQPSALNSSTVLDARKKESKRDSKVQGSSRSLDTGIGKTSMDVANVTDDALLFVEHSKEFGEFASFTLKDIGDRNLVKDTFDSKKDAFQSWGVMPEASKKNSPDEGTVSKPGNTLFWENAPEEMPHFSDDELSMDEENEAFWVSLAAEVDSWGDKFDLNEKTKEGFMSCVGDILNCRNEEDTMDHQVLDMFIEDWAARNDLNDRIRKDALRLIKGLLDVSTSFEDSSTPVEEEEPLLTGDDLKQQRTKLQKRDDFEQYFSELVRNGRMEDISKVNGDYERLMEEARAKSRGEGVFKTSMNSLFEGGEEQMEENFGNPTQGEEGNDKQKAKASSASDCHSKEKDTLSQEGPHKAISTKVAVVDIIEMKSTESWLHKHALIGHLLGPRPPVEYIEGWMKNMWGKKGINVTSYRFLRKGYIFFLFDTEEMVSKIIGQGLWTMRNQPLYLEQWSPDFSPDIPRPSRAPVWVELPDLPFSLFNQLNAICAPLGKVIGQEKEGFFNPRGSPQVCVLVDLSEDLSTTLRIEDASGRLIREQEVVYKNLPNSCFLCGLADHRVKECPSKKRKPTQKKEETKWVERRAPGTKVDEKTNSNVSGPTHKDTKAEFIAPKKVAPSPKKSADPADIKSPFVLKNPYAALIIEGEGEDEVMVENDFVKDTQILQVVNDIGSIASKDEQYSFPVFQDPGTEVNHKGIEASGFNDLRRLQPSKFHNVEFKGMMPIQQTLSPKVPPLNVKQYKRRHSLAARKSLLTFIPDEKRLNTKSRPLGSEKLNDTNGIEWEEVVRKELNEEDAKLAVFLANGVPSTQEGEEKQPSSIANE